MNTESVLNQIIQKIKNFIQNTYEWNTPEKFNPPALVYRYEIKQKPVRMKLYKKLSDRTLWKVADTELTIVLFYVNKTPDFKTLDDYLKKKTLLTLNGVNVKLFYSPFAPAERDEFKKLGLKTWKAQITAKFPEVIETQIIQVDIEVSTQ